MRARWVDRVGAKRKRITARALALGVFLAVPTVNARAQLGFLGPRGTFSELATETYRRTTPSVGRSVPFETMTAVVEAIRDGTVARGVLPVASTVAGFPAESSRLLLAERDPGFRVIAEIVLPIELHLAVKSGTVRHAIRTILSHPNALGEASAFLAEQFPGVLWEETASAAAAAERVRNGDGSLAAVVSVAAAKLYDLDILESAIQEDPHNATSFWVVARAEDAPPPDTARNLVLLVDAPVDSPILSDTIASSDELGFNVVFVNSTPLPGELCGFRYLVSLEAVTPVVADRLRVVLGSTQVLGLGWFD